MPSKRDQLAANLGQVASDIAPSPPPMRKGAGVAGMFGGIGETAQSQESESALSQHRINAQSQQSETAKTQNSENAKTQNNTKAERKSRGILVQPRLYKALQAAAFDADVKDYEMIDAAFAEYLQRRGRLPVELSDLVADLTARGLVQGE